MPRIGIIIVVRLLLVALHGEAARHLASSSCNPCEKNSIWSTKYCTQCDEFEGPVQAWVNEVNRTVSVSSSSQNSTRRCLPDADFICNVNPGNSSVQHGSCCLRLNRVRENCFSEDSDCFSFIFLHNTTESHDGIPETGIYPARVLFNWKLASSINESTTTTPSSASCKSGEACSSKVRSSSRSKLRIYIIAGSIAAVAILTLLSCLVVLRNRRSFSSQKRNYSDRTQILIDGGVTGALSPTVFTFKELKSATKCFAESRLLGGGGFSTVYQGKLPDGRIVAVKRLNQGNKQGIQQFQNEVNILSKVRHANLVQLLGYCLEGRDLLLVYEYVLNGTLADHLHGDRGNGLAMETRLSIALDTAHALAYLHFDVNPPIYHRDVKSSNILLDKDFKAKVADFGLSRLTHLDATHISTAPQGTPGYLDPDYHESYQLTDKSDVYSFGVVLLELVSRKKAVDMSRDKKEINLASMALSKIHSGALHELFDADLSVKHWKLLTRLVEVAFRCLASEKDDRPSMLEVVAELEQLSSIGVMNFSSRRKIKLDSSGEFKKLRSSSNNSTHSNKLEEDSPTSVQMKWPSTHTSPSNSRSEEALLKHHKFSG